MVEEWLLRFVRVCEHESMMLKGNTSEKVQRRLTVRSDHLGLASRVGVVRGCKEANTNEVTQHSKELACASEDLGKQVKKQPFVTKGGSTNRWFTENRLILCQFTIVTGLESTPNHVLFHSHPQNTLGSMYRTYESESKAGVLRSHE